MTDPQSTAERRARRLVHFYPRAWRDRYGDEFVAFLADDITERPFAPARTADLVRCALTTRLRQANSGSATAALALFVMAGASLWAQLTVSWQWSRPSSELTRVGMLLMSVSAVTLLALALLGTARLLFRGLNDDDTRRAILLPTAVALIATATLIVVSVHIGYGWPGTGGYAWHGSDLIPTWLARPVWAATLWVSSYWAHPTELARFPTIQIVWMLAAPALITAIAISTWCIQTQLKATPRIPAVVMGCFLIGSACWVVAGAGTHIPRLPGVGLIDVGALVAMFVSLSFAFRHRHGLPRAQ